EFSQPKPAQLMSGITNAQLKEVGIPRLLGSWDIYASLRDRVFAVTIGDTPEPWCLLWEVGGDTFWRVPRSWVEL
ncbi:MAG: hypothetical protein ACXABY_03670, partial [Candidatus Thorarchaeota archaeon]